MNNLRVPVTVLLVIIALIGAWLYLARPHGEDQVVLGQTSPTSATAQTSATPSLPDPASVPAAIVGTWTSTDDQNYSVAITGDGKWTDRYKQSGPSGDITESGTYSLFTSANVDPSFAGTAQPGIVYIKLVEGPDTYFYSVLQANGGNLQLSYLARGNTLSFVKAQ